MSLDRASRSSTRMLKQSRVAAAGARFQTNPSEALRDRSGLRELPPSAMPTGLEGAIVATIDSCRSSPEPAFFDVALIALACPGVGARKPVLKVPRSARFGVSSARLDSFPFVVVPKSS